MANNQGPIPDLEQNLRLFGDSCEGLRLGQDRRDLRILRSSRSLALPILPAAQRRPVCGAGRLAPHKDGWSPPSGRWRGTKPDSTRSWGANMKFTRWAVGLWSLTALLMLAGNADAWLFNHCGGCHGCHSHCHHCYETHICCRAYNAFTPICWGNLYCDGCCPNMGGGGGC